MNRILTTTELSQNTPGPMTAQQWHAIRLCPSCGGDGVTREVVRVHGQDWTDLVECQACDGTGSARR